MRRAGARADEQRNGTRGCYPSIGSAAAEIMIEAARGCVWCGAHPKNIGPWRCPRRSGLVAAALTRSRAWRTLAETGQGAGSPSSRRPDERERLPAPGLRRLKITRSSLPGAPAHKPTRRLVAATTMHTSAPVPPDTLICPDGAAPGPQGLWGGATASTRATARRSFRPSQPAPWNRRRGLLRPSTTGRASACGPPRPLT